MGGTWGGRESQSRASNFLVLFLLAVVASETFAEEKRSLRVYPAETKAVEDVTCVPLDPSRPLPLSGVELLNGTNLRMAFYAGEQSECDNKAPGCESICVVFGEITDVQNEDDTTRCWSGHDVDLIEILAQIGNFRYTIVSMGEAATISTYSGGYTRLARTMLGHTASDIMRDIKAPDPDLFPVVPDKFDRVHIFGQGTWRVNEGRNEWAIWSIATFTDSVQFLTTSTSRIEKNLIDRVLLPLQPFSSTVWIVLVITLLVVVWIFVTMGTLHSNSIMEISRLDVLYSACMSPFGQPNLAVNSMASIKGLTLPWVVMATLFFQFYVANLTAILAQGPKYEIGLNGVADLKTYDKHLCVNKGAANDAFFTKHPNFGNGGDGLIIERKAGVTAQIEAVAKGECDSAEVTLEDYYKWAKNLDPNVKEKKECSVAMVGQPIARRPRGLMSDVRGSCIIVGFNSLYHLFGSRDCSKKKFVWCDAMELAQNNYPVPKCAVINKEFSVASLDIPDMIGLILLLGVGTFFGYVGSYLGIHSTDNSKCWTYFDYSKIARQSRRAEIIPLTERKRKKMEGRHKRLTKSEFGEPDENV